MLTALEAVPFKNSIDIPKKNWRLSSSTVNAISRTTLIILYKWFISIKNPHLTLAPTCKTCSTPDGEYWRTQVVEGSHGWPPTPPIHHWRNQMTTWVNQWTLGSEITCEMVCHLSFCCVRKKLNCILQKREETRCWTCFLSKFHQQNDLFFSCGEQKNIFVWTEAFIEVICVRVWVATGLLFTPSLWHE